MTGRQLALAFLPLLAAACAGAETTVVTPALTWHSGDEWATNGGEWQFRPGRLEQRETERLGAAIWRGPAFGDVRLTTEFYLAPVGRGVRAAALLLRATGTLTYYWLHLDSKNRQVILTRSTPRQTWVEIARRRCPELTAGVWHTALASMQGQELSVSVDGREVIRATDGHLTAGRVGVGTSQGRVIFRNLRVEGEVVPMADLREEQPPFKVISRGEVAGPYQSFPDACRLQNGDIVAVFYAGYGHVSLPNAAWPRGGRICLVRSRDEGRTWSAPEILYDGPEDNRDPHIAQLADGRLVCSFFNYAPAPGKATDLGCFLVWSADNGKTWDTTPQRVTDDVWALSAPVREVPDGTLLLGIYREGNGGAWGGVVRSTDHGQTWSAPIPIGAEAKLPLDAETDLIRLQDGTLYAALRSSRVNMHYATSADQGLTWSPVHDIGFVGHAPHFTRLSTGAILLTHRVPATALHVSRDEGRTWQGPYELDSVGGAYPATVELRDGTVLAIYYEEGEGSAVRALRFRLLADGIEPLSLD